MSKKLVLLGFDSIIPWVAEKFMNEGKMPNLRKIVENGYSSEVIPNLPPWTPPGWATIGTGTYPSTHGIEGFGVHFEGESLEKEHDGFDSNLCKAAYFWETAEKQGKKAIILKYPGYWPHRMKNGIQIGGCAGYGGRKSHLDISHSHCFATQDWESLDEVDIIQLKKAEWVNLPEDLVDPLATVIQIPNLRKGEDITYEILIVGNCICLAREKDYNKIFRKVKEGEWTGWITENISLEGKKVDINFQMKLMNLDRKKKSVKIYVSQIHPESGYSTPKGIDQELYENVGPYVEWTEPYDLWMGWIDSKTQLEIYSRHANWMSNTIKYLLKNKGWDIFVTQWHPIDSVQHIFWGGIDPLHPDYKEVDENKYWGIIGEVYKLADSIIGSVLESVPQECIISIVGDHGHDSKRYNFNINNFLAKNKLLSFKKDPKSGAPIIDWKKTKAFGMGPIHIFLNVRGRDPEGIVEPGGEYENLKENIKDLLYQVKHEETGKYIVKVAFGREEVDAFGIYGGGIGDVVYSLRPGYDSGAAMRVQSLENFGLSEDMKIFEKTSLYKNQTSTHSAMFPTTKNVRTFFAVMGPNVRKHVKPRGVPMQLVDVAPTITYLADLPQPEDAIGNIFKIMKKRGRCR